MLRLGCPRQHRRLRWGGLGMRTLEDSPLTTVDDLIAWLVRFDEQIVEQSTA